MRNRQGFIVSGLIVWSIAVIDRLAVWFILSEPKIVGIQAWRITPKLMIVAEIGLFASVGLVCLGMLSGQRTISDQDRRADGFNPFDDPKWMGR